MASFNLAQLHSNLANPLNNPLLWTTHEPSLISFNRIVSGELVDSVFLMDVVEKAYLVRDFMKDQIKTNSKHNDRRSHRYYQETQKKRDKTDGNDISHLLASIKKAREARDEKAILFKTCQYMRTLENMDSRIRNKLEPRFDEVRNKFFDRGSGQEWRRLDLKKYGMKDGSIEAFERLQTLHNIHTSVISPIMVAYYPTLLDYRRGKEVRTKLGKYLTTYKDELHLTELEIKSIVEAHSSYIESQKGWEVRYIESTDKKGWEDIYNSEVNSCMKGESAVHVYAHPLSDLKLAYLSSSEGTIARCIVREGRDDLEEYHEGNSQMRGWVRIYPDDNGNPEGRFLLDYLKTNGYPNRTSLEGCLLELDQDGDYDCVCPYIDSGGGGAQKADIVTYRVEGRDQKFLQIDVEGEYDCTNTNGFASRADCECDDCGEHFCDDDMTYVGRNDDSRVCNGCLDNYNYAYTRGRNQENIYYEYTIEVNGEYYDEEYISEYNIYQCEASDNYYHIDDMVSTSRGLIHFDYAIHLDYQDNEGYDFAHENDVAHLSDGSTCHDADLETLQQELDEQIEEKLQTEIELMKGAQLNEQGTI